MPVTDFLERNAKLYTNETALVELNPELEDNRRLTWKEYDLIEPTADTVIDEEVHCNYSIYTAIIDDMDAVNFCTSDGYEYHEIDGDVTRSIVEYFANTLEELAKQIAEAHDATYVEIFNGYCNRLNGGVYEYYKSYNSYDGFPSIPLIEWKADDDEN